LSGLRPTLIARLELVLQVARVPGALITVALPGVPSRLQPGSTPDPFHSDEHSSIGFERARIASVVCKSIELALQLRSHRLVRVLACREETVLRSATPLQAWVLVVQRRGRRPVYMKGLFAQHGHVALLSLHESDRSIA